MPVPISRISNGGPQIKLSIAFNVSKLMTLSLSLSHSMTTNKKKNDDKKSLSPSCLRRQAKYNSTNTHLRFFTASVLLPER